VLRWLLLAPGSTPPQPRHHLSRATTRTGRSTGASCLLPPLIERAATEADLAAKVEAAKKRLHR
jgi:hypothetical protein